MRRNQREPSEKVDGDRTARGHRQPARQRLKQHPRRRNTATQHQSDHGVHQYPCGQTVEGVHHKPQRERVVLTAFLHLLHDVVESLVVWFQQSHQTHVEGMERNTDKDVRVHVVVVIFFEIPKHIDLVAGGQKQARFGHRHRVTDVGKTSFDIFHLTIFEAKKPRLKYQHREDGRQTVHEQILGFHLRFGETFLAESVPHVQIGDDHDVMNQYHQEKSYENIRRFVLFAEQRGLNQLRKIDVRMIGVHPFDSVDKIGDVQQRDREQESVHQVVVHRQIQFGPDEGGRRGGLLFLLNGGLIRLLLGEYRVDVNSVPTVGERGSQQIEQFHSLISRQN